MIGDIMLFSLERWDDVWRRNQFLVRELLQLHPEARILFVAPPVDVLRRRPVRDGHPRSGLREVEPQRLWELVPRKIWPRVLGPFADQSLFRQARAAANQLGLEEPALWINDSVYARLANDPSRPVVYDITDDWLLEGVPAREARRRQRRERTLLARSGEVVVCSEDLARSRGATRAVHHIPNAVDADYFTRPYVRPADLPPGRTAVYVGTLHEERLDLDLVLSLSEAAICEVVLVGPVCLRPLSLAKLRAHSNIHLLGPRPYQTVPAYLQHASVVIVPHVVTPFTASLDPIKSYECLAVGTRTIATPVAGFTRAAGCVAPVARDEWVAAVERALSDGAARRPTPDLPTWRQRAEAFSKVLGRARSVRTEAADPS